MKFIRVSFILLVLLTCHNFMKFTSLEKALMTKKFNETDAIDILKILNLDKLQNNTNDIQFEEAEILKHKRT